MTGNDDFGDAFRHLRLNLVDGAKLELSLDGLKPVLVGGLTVDGSSKRGIVDSSAAYAEGTGQVDVLTPPFSVSIR